MKKPGDTIFYFTALGAAGMAGLISFVSSIQEDYDKALFFLALCVLNGFLAWSFRGEP
jgi:hypothetical protein